MTLNESLKRVKFKYANYKNDPNPEVKILDHDYKTGDILGYNINYFANKEDASEGLDAIDDFARLVDSDNRQRYERIRDFFDKSNIAIRRYKRKHISDVEEIGRGTTEWASGSLNNNKPEFEE